MKKYDYSIVKDILKKQGYELLSEVYNNPREKLNIKDNNGYKYYLTLDQFLKGNNFRKFGNKNPFSIENIRLWLKDNFVDYEILSNEFTGTHDKLSFKCNHGHEFKMAWADFQSGQRCSVCKGIKNADRCRFSYKDVKLDIESKDYTLLSDHYNNASQKLLIKCNKNHIFQLTYRHFLRGQRCPYCIGSGGEIEIQKFLEKSNLKYEREYSFDDLIYKDKLRFDFAVFNENKLLCLIEFDGIQHFKPKNFGGISMEEAIENFKVIQKRDKMKDNYCKKKEINLIRIHYTQINEIEDLLNKTIPR